MMSDSSDPRGSANPGGDEPGGGIAFIAWPVAALAGACYVAYQQAKQRG